MTEASPGGLVPQWKQFLSRPEVQAALLQFSANMLSPRRRGFLPQLGDALGAAGGAAGRVQQAEQQERQTRVLEQGVEARKTQAEAAKKRAEAAQTQAGTLEKQLPLKEREVAIQEERARLATEQGKIAKQTAQARLDALLQAAERKPFADFLNREFELFKQQVELYKVAPAGSPPPKFPSSIELLNKYNQQQRMFGGKTVSIGITSDAQIDALARGAVARGIVDRVRQNLELNEATPSQIAVFDRKVAELQAAVKAPAEAPTPETPPPAREAPLVRGTEEIQQQERATAARRARSVAEALGESRQENVPQERSKVAPIEVPPGNIFANVKVPSRLARSGREFNLAFGQALLAIEEADVESVEALSAADKRAAKSNAAVRKALVQRFGAQAVRKALK